jgi:hypothetical protein
VLAATLPCGIPLVRSEDLKRVRDDPSEDLFGVGDDFSVRQQEAVPAISRCEGEPRHPTSMPSIIPTDVIPQSMPSIIPTDVIPQSMPSIIPTDVLNAKGLDVAQ